MKNLLYIGNQLRHHKGTVTSIDVLGPFLAAAGYNLSFASSKKSKFFRFFDMVKTVFNNRKKVDYVLIDTYSTLNFYFALLVSQLCRVLNLKYIPILHGGDLPKRLKRNPKYCGLIFNNSYKNVSPSSYIKSEFEKYGFYNLVCIPNAIEIHKYPFYVRDFKSIRMLWVRSFSKIYNPLLAVRVLKSLQDEGFSASLCMVGPDKDGSLQKTKDFADSINVKVEFTGKLSKKEWIELSSDCNIFLNTTNYDNMPVSVIEAMALGLAVISTNVGGMPYLINNNEDGKLVNPNDVTEFVDVIKEIILSPDAAIKIAMNARRKVEGYDWEKIKSQWISLLG